MARHLFVQEPGRGYRQANAADIPNVAQIATFAKRVTHD